MLMITYDSKFREIPNKTNTCFGVLLFLPPRTHMGIHHTKSRPGIFFDKKQLLRRDPLEKKHLLFFTATNSILFKEKTCDKSTATKVFTHHPALVKGAKQLVVQEAFDTWRVGQSSQGEKVEGLGGTPARKAFISFDADFSWEKTWVIWEWQVLFFFLKKDSEKKTHIFLVQNTRNEIKLFVLEGWILRYLISFHFWRHTVGSKKR